MCRFIEGVGRSQSTLFPERLEDWIDADVDDLDLGDIGFERVAAARTGRPGYHPAVLRKPFIYGYVKRVTSTRRLEREAGRNVEMMSFHTTSAGSNQANFRISRPLRAASDGPRKR